MINPAHIKLVKSIAKYLRAGLPANVELDDLVQAGMLGLLDAIDRYDPVVGSKFETYASARIRGSIMDEIRSYDHLSRRYRRSANAITAATHKLEGELHRQPSDAEMSVELGVTTKQYRKDVQNTLSATLLYYEDEQMEAGDDDSFLDKLSAAQDTAADDDLSERLSDAVETLPEEQRNVLSMRYDQGLSLIEAGEILGVSGARISQIHAKAIKGLRASLTRKPEH